MDEKRSFVICCACGLLLLVVLWDDFDGMNLKLKQQYEKQEQEMGEDYLKQFLTKDCLKPDEMKEKKYKGKLNVHRWMDSCPCGASIDRGLRIHTRFPRHPELDFVIYTTELTKNGQYSQRLFGYITPNITGSYRFAVSSSDNSELWISQDSSPKSVELAAYVGDVSSNMVIGTDYLRHYDKFKSQKSQIFSLQKDHDYYIEALHRSQRHHGHISIVWQKPGTSNFIPVDPAHLSLFLPDDGDFSPSLIDHKECILQDHKPLHLRVMPLINRQQLALEKDDMCSKYKIIGHNEVSTILDTCPYEPSYMPRFVPEYHGANYYAPYWLTDVYPDDKTSDMFEDINGNKIIEKKEVDAIVGEYMRKLNSSGRQRYQLKKIVNIEKKIDKKRGIRYLLELDLLPKGQAQSVLLSEYVFKFDKVINNSSQKLTTELCYPKGFHWNKSAKVYIILPVKNYGYWVKYFIDELIKTYTETPEKNFHLVIIDFNSTDFNAKEYLKNSALNKSFTLLTMYGDFQKPLAINKGAATVKDPNAILFLMDLHVTVPPCFFDIVRKHTIKGKSGFFPILLRLKCSTSDAYPDGGWGVAGYGLLGIYKEDWDRFGGEDAERYKNTWGGEDWNLLDRVLNAKIESERFKWPKLFHFLHSKQGSWYKLSDRPDY